MFILKKYKYRVLKYIYVPKSQTIHLKISGHVLFVEVIWKVPDTLRLSLKYKGAAFLDSHFCHHTCCSFRLLLRSLHGSALFTAGPVVLSLRMRIIRRADTDIGFPRRYPTIAHINLGQRAGETYMQAVYDCWRSK